MIPLTLITLSLSSCVTGTSYTASGTPNMGSFPTIQQRQTQINTEETGSFYYGRRYHVNKTRFWGYLRKPRQPWSEARLAIMNEQSIKQPDRLSEDGPRGFRHGYDQNYEYKVTGTYTGRKIYDPNSNLFLPEFRPSGFTVLNRTPGWLFSPKDHYNPSYITLINSSVNQQR